MCQRVQKFVKWRSVINTNPTFEKFTNCYPPDKIQAVSFDYSGRLFEIAGVKTFFEKYTGCTFGGGVYRVLLSDEIEKWNVLVLGIFSQFEGVVECFAADWMGRIFAWDFVRQKVILLDPGFAEALKIPCTFIELHNQEFVDFPNESLSKELFVEYIHESKVKIGRDQCVGYKISPFLGGKDNLDNLELTDLEVYWSVCSDIYNEVKTT